MYSLLLTSVSFLLVAPSLVLAETTPTEKCYTAYGTKSVATVPTLTKTERKEVTKTVIRNTHPHTTVTPTTHVTSTVTNTETETENKPQQTDTAIDTTSTTITTTTTLDTVTQRETNTVTKTDTSTYQGTSTISAPAGFTGALDTLPGSELRKRDQDGRGGSLAPRAQKPKPLAFDASAKKYPTKVMCIDFTYHTKTTRSTRSRTGTVTKTAKPSTVSDTVTKSTTVTTTIFPADASTTVTTTVSDTSTITESPTTTVTDTETATETAIIATATAHAACNPKTYNNYVGGANGHGFSSAGGLGGSQFYGSAAANAQDCCEQCHGIGSSCIFGVFTTDLPAGVQCELDITDSGQPQSGDVCMLSNAAFSVDSGYFGMNGPANQITFLCPGSA